MREIKTSICKLSKAEIHELLDVIAHEVRTARHVCRKCGRAAHHKRLLCKPVPIVNLLPEVASD
jgi:ribosomal protein S27AE